MNSVVQPIMFLSSSSRVHLLFYVLVTFQTFTTISAVSHSSGNETDLQALLKIKSMITPNPYGPLTSWNSSLHFCNWTGVTCGKRHQRVTYLQLYSKGLEGPLSSHVGNLSFLRGLSLSNNSFQGNIPHELGQLSRLRFLILGLNKFNGVIPTSISYCSNLERIDLSNNELVGSIPKEISFLSKLIIVSLETNLLTGGIPPSLGNITSVEEFSVSGNPLGGMIPNTLGQWKKLHIFYFGNCNLSGTIPLSVFNLSLLTSFSLSDNQLSGTLPPSIGEMLPNLEGLQLSSNKLGGLLPPSISNCSRLTNLQMGNNMFSGKLTIDFAKLRDISVISLYDNLFGSNEDDGMKFIDSLENCTRLKWLDLYNCELQGMLPASIGNLSNQLHLIHLAKNHLSGNLPSSIGNLVGLDRLSLGGNRFTGNIPTTIGSLPKLEVLFLYQNQLSGAIPDEIGNLSLLIALSLFSNKLERVIPSSLGNCHRLLELYLYDNKLNGRIPPKLLQLSSLSKNLDLSQNKLFGSLPTEIGELKMLTTMNLSYNNLSGNIPSSLGDCVTLSRLSFRGNSFQGIIPPSLSSMKGLEVLDVSHNNLSGLVPKFFEKMLLEYVNLSYNDFEGELPMVGVFANVSRFSVLGNSRLCGGLLELGLPKCKETNKHKKKFPHFVVVILILSSTLFTMACLAYAWCLKNRKRQSCQSKTSERFIKVSYSQLLKATDGFSDANLIGKGGFSSVYKGILGEDDDTFVAIKVFHLQNRGAQRSFMRECEALRNIRHRNLLKIITSCSSIDFQGNDFKALVYEFMPNGSLHDWLYSSESASRLSLLQVMNILMDVACALDYIHNHCTPSIVHGDLKPSNILLDDDMVAHIGDFGLARFLGTSYPNSSTGIRGTIGYVAPEYGLGNEMTSSGDVYSFGILLLEVMTGKNPSDDTFNEGLSLHKFASTALPNNIMDVIDVKILNAYQHDGTITQNNDEYVKKLEECLASTIKIGVSCTMDSPQERIDIKKVLHDMQHVLDTLQRI